MPKPTINTKEIANRIAKEIGLTQLKTLDILNLFIQTITTGLIADGWVDIEGFGNFQLRRHKPKRMRNVLVDKIFITPAKNGVHFEPSQKMKKKALKAEIPKVDPRPKRPLPKGLDKRKKPEVE